MFPLSQPALCLDSGGGGGRVRYCRAGRERRERQREVGKDRQVEKRESEREGGKQRGRQRSWLFKKPLTACP